MKLLTTSLLALGLTLTAHAQDTSRDSEQITSVTKKDMRYVIESASYSVTEDLNSGIGFVAKTDEDMIFGAQGKACSGSDQDQEPCLGIEFFVILDGNHDAEYANDINQRWSAIKAVRGASSRRAIWLMIGQATRREARVRGPSTLRLAAVASAAKASSSSAISSIARGPGVIQTTLERWP